MSSNEFGPSLTGTVNDVAVTLQALKNAGFTITRPADADLRAVACQILGISDDVGVEQLVSVLVRSIVAASS
jgi:hypothetical protein